MKMFLDSAKIEEIRHALEVWNIDGLTTNPRHVATSEKSTDQVLDEVAELFTGTDKPVSVEVNPHLTDWRAMVEEARSLAARSPNFVVKIGAGEAGFRAVRELSEQNIPTNVTLVFSVTQAWHAARSGAAFVSPFLGWKEAHGEDVSHFLTEIRRMLDHGGYPTRVLAAAVRNSRQIALAAMAGADCVTAGFSVYKESFRHPFTDMGHEIFGAAWDETADRNS